MAANSMKISFSVSSVSIPDEVLGGGVRRVESDYIPYAVEKANQPMFYENYGVVDPNSTAENEVQNYSVFQAQLKQTVHFFDMVEGYEVAANEPSELEYNERNKDAVVLLNYHRHEYTRENDATTFEIGESQGWAPIRGVDERNEGLAITIFRQEIGFDEQGREIPLTVLQPVDTNVTRFHLRDYNIANGRFYKYVLYPTNEDKPLTSVEGLVFAKWEGWSITELHPLDTTGKRFSATSDDVWVFNANVETGEQSQNLVVNQQQTLGEFARYAQAPQNFISSNVSCLLGEVLPANYVKKMSPYNVKNTKTGMFQTKVGERYVAMGGYQERVSANLSISSNDKVDMLLAWRKLVRSGNPKLLKDRKGQSFLVAITENSNKPMDNNRLQPDTISFSWVQIGTLDGVQIIDTSL